MDHYARHLRMPETRVRVIAPDVGGGFGLKIHLYGDEMAAVAASMLLGRPVKFVADRLESFVGDFHAAATGCVRAWRCRADGDMLGVDVDDLYGIGAYSGYPRGSANEGLQVSNLVGAAYRRDAYRPSPARSSRTRRCTASIARWAIRSPVWSARA